MSIKKILMIIAPKQSDSNKKKKKRNEWNPISTLTYIAHVVLM